MAAEDLLDSGAPDTYTVNHIASHADVGISTLYGCFPGKKDAITWAVEDREEERVLKRLPGPLDEPDAAPQLEAVIDALVTQRLSRPTLTRSLRAETLRLSLWGEVDPGVSRLAARIKRCLESVEFADRAREPHAVSEVMAIVDGMIDAACARKDCSADGLSWRITETLLYHLGWYMLD